MIELLGIKDPLGLPQRRKEGAEGSPISERCVIAEELQAVDLMRLIKKSRPQYCNASEISGDGLQPLRLHAVMPVLYRPVARPHPEDVNAVSLRCIITGQRTLHV